MTLDILTLLTLLARVHRKAKDTVLKELALLIPLLFSRSTKSARFLSRNARLVLDICVSVPRIALVTNCQATGISRSAREEGSPGTRA